MKLPEICIKRPVLSIVLTLLLIIIGVVSHRYLPLRQYPQIERPVISISTNYEGASPEIIETQITMPLEAALAGIEGLDYMTSTSETDNSNIDLHLKVGRSLEDAASDVRDKIGKIRLPEGARRPIIKKADSDASPIMYLTLYGEGVDNSVLAEHAEKRIKNQLEAVAGVSSIDIFGGNGFVMHIWLDPSKMAAYGVTTNEVANALRQQNVHIPAGRLSGDERQYHLTTAANIKDAKGFNDIIVGKQKNYLVRVSDIGFAEFSPPEPKSLVRFNDKPAIGIGIIKKSIANPLDVSNEVRKLVPDLRKSLARGMKLDVALDKTIFIQESIDEVYQTIFEATACVIFVMLLFLWSFRAAVIPLVTIPVSLIATFTLLYIFGFSINLLTLLAMVLAIGLVVDDAIVVMENIYRYIERGMHPFQAAIKGSKEISFAIIAMTLTLAAVYAPIALSTGRAGKLFTEFAITLAGAVIISGFVALTLSPMMCSRLLKPHKEKEPNLFEKYYRAFENGYVRVLDWALRNTLVVSVMAFFLVFSGLLVALYLMPSELAPKEDQGIVITHANTPQGATLDSIRHHMNYAEEPFRNIPEVEKRLTIIQAPRSMAWNILTPWQVRKRPAQSIADEAKPQLQSVTGLQAYAGVLGGLGGGGRGGDELVMIMRTTKSYEEINRAASLLLQELRKRGILDIMQTDKGTDVHEFRVDINRDKAASMGVDVKSIGETLDALISGRRVSDFKKENEQFDVVLSIDPQSRRGPNDLTGIYVKGQKNTMIPISNFMMTNKEPVPTQINRYDQMRSVTLTSTPAKGVSLGEAVDIIQKVAEDILPDHIKVDFSGQTKEMLESKNTMYLIFGLALIFIYLVMAAQFESFLDPFIIMFTVPLSLAGGVLVLKIANGSFNMFSSIGFVTLIGLITKHGILIVDFANKISQQGKGAYHSIKEAAALRFRPIMMTTLAMVLGAFPLVWASGAGAESRRQIGYVIVGGMSIGTLFTVFIVPIMYVLISRKPKQEIQ